MNRNFPENLSDNTTYIVLMHIEKFERQLFEESTSQFYAQSRSFFVSYCDKNENYYKSVTSTT